MRWPDRRWPESSAGRRVNEAMSIHKVVPDVDTAKSADAVLEIRGVTKTFPGVRALANVDFDCRPGEVHALVGENGSGKSTLIKAASGVLSPDEGTITIGGETLGGGGVPRARRLGLITAYQDTSLVEDLSVADKHLAVVQRHRAGAAQRPCTRSWTASRCRSSRSDVVATSRPGSAADPRGRTGHGAPSAGADARRADSRSGHAAWPPSSR